MLIKNLCGIPLIMGAFEHDYDKFNQDERKQSASPRGYKSMGKIKKQQLKMQRIVATATVVEGYLPKYLLVLSR